MLNSIHLKRGLKMAGNSGKEVGEAIGAIILGIVGGLALGAIIEAISKPKCPVCNQTIEKNTAICPHCSASLQWRS
jgi:hypothetical protein